MEKNNSLYCLLSLVLILFNASIIISEESPRNPSTETGRTKGILSAEKAVTFKTLDELKSYLKKSYMKYGNNINLNSADLYIDALAKIKAYRTIIEKKPDSEKAIAYFTACSLSTEAAVVQLMTRYNEYSIKALQAKINAVLNELNRVHEKINLLVSSKVSSLKLDLDAEKEKARKLREEAEKKFSELQSSLIQVTNDARGTIISMSDILFEVDKANLTPDLKTNLAKIAGILLVYKTSNIIVEGHTDNQGSEKYNQKLSEKRAENVMNFLVDQGVSLSRLSSVGYGFSRPIDDNSTKEGRQKNRRVDLVVQEIKPEE